jgi:Mlc titration factor MtfA (ptsG expression regulator)
VAHDRWLDTEEKRRLRELVRVFIAEKRWEGCGGLELDDEIRVTIAAEACLLILELPHEPYRRVHTILVYPSTVVPPERPLRAFEVPTAPLRGPVPILGETQRQGPIILVWDAVERTARHPERGHNVVFHEFAHALDLLDGVADGTPPLHDRAEVRRWAEVCSREYAALGAQAARGRSGLLDAYGATNEAEFFAVATECFFDRPLELRRRHPELYAVLQGFYRQDPAARVAAGQAR